MKPLERAIKICGSQAKLAEAIETTQPNVWYWLHKCDGRVPAEIAVKIEQATDYEVSRSQLRPDLWERVRKQA